jgi:hypothetical protein
MCVDDPTHVGARQRRVEDVRVLVEGDHQLLLLGVGGRGQERQQQRAEDQGQRLADHQVLLWGPPTAVGVADAS